MQLQQIGATGMYGLNIEAQLATKLVEALTIISYCSPEARDEVLNKIVVDLRNGIASLATKLGSPIPPPPDLGQRFVR